MKGDESYYPISSDIDIRTNYKGISIRDKLAHDYLVALITGRQTSFDNMKDKEMEKEINIKYRSRGGQYPYQADGVINDKDWFYYRARHNNVSLELYNSEEEMDELIMPETCDNYASIEKNSFVTDEEAEDDIKTLYNIIKNKEDGITT